MLIHVSALSVVARMRSNCVTPLQDTTGIPSRAGVITITSRAVQGVYKDFVMRSVAALRVVMGIVLVFTLAAVVCISQPGTRQQYSYAIAQSFDQKLQQKVQFSPKANAPLDQLIEVAKTFQIPMGIEWNESLKCSASSAGFPTQGTVLELLNAIVRRCPTQRLTVELGIVHVYSRFARHPHNILNLRLQEFQVRHTSVFDAQFLLRLVIEMQLHPERFTGGYNIGHGSPAGQVFSVPNVNFSAKDVTVRDALDGIIKSSGNALWVARLSAASVNQRVPLSRMYNNDKEIIRIFQLLPLSEAK